MSEELPEGWARVEVGDVFACHGGGTPSRTARAYWKGKIPWLSSGDIKSDLIRDATESITERGLQESAARICRTGSVLVVVRSGILKHSLPVAVLAQEAAINQDIKCFDSGDDELNRWLALAWRASARALLAENREGTTVQSVKLETLNGFTLPVPPPREQRRIVAKLEELLGKVDACKQRLAQVPELLKRFRQSVLAAACSGRLTSDLRSDAIEEDELPSDWVSLPVESLFEVRTGGTPSRKITRYFERGTIPWVKTAEVQNCDIACTEEFITELAARESNAKVFPSGTILVAMYGEGRTRGQIGRLMFPAATNQACAALINEGLPRETNQYIFYYLLSQYDQLRAESVGGNQPNLNLGIIKSWRIALPPLTEQREIVRRVQRVLALLDRFRVHCTNGAAEVTQLTSSLLAMAFRGELVPTEAELARRERRAYEPASVLLERVRQERMPPGSPKAMTATAPTRARVRRAGGRA